MTRWRAVGTVLPALAALAVAGQASAAVVTLDYEEPIPGLDPETAYALTLTAGDGEANVLRVARTLDGYEVSDASGLSAGPGCVSTSPTEATCATPEPADTHSVFVDAADLADRVELGDLFGASTEIRGGSGDDLILGGPRDDLIFGGSGTDRIAARAGDDEIDGGSGGDLISGGPGVDVLTYEARRKPVQADLAAGTGGERGEADSFVEIEGVTGGRAADRLLGDAGPNTLNAGEPGPRDVVVGRGGDDILLGRRARGGKGDDSLDGRYASCGAGHDVVYRQQFKTRGPYGRDCEAVLSVLVFLETRAAGTGRRHVDLSVRCRMERCRGKLALRDKRGPLGSADYSLLRGAGGEAETVRIHLDRRPAERKLRLDLSGPRAYQRDWFRLRLSGPG